MAAVHPDHHHHQTPSSSSTTAASSYMTCRRETFTVWMKSLVFHGNGCTVFDSSGAIVYRIDNYDKKSGGSEVYLMDLRGKVLFSVRRKKLGPFRRWSGYRWSGSRVMEERPLFDVRRYCNILKRDVVCHVSLGTGKARACGYTIQGLAGKLEFKLTDSHGGLVAEVRKKQLSSGLVLGEDVLSLVVEPQTDHSLVMALVTVYGIMADKI
ncbi:protein LURP-one-related 3-like [Diospyros lotus]|uniref:protein LURP-one-related 3-like n=1 Tax=Diospyros lotus TaxID=55363 RepID=UPI002253DC15|nr:protein LURP-one-related 3-like [Diospyros lotus]